MNRKIYIAGKIGTYNIDNVSEECIDKFRTAERELKNKFPDCRVYNQLEFAIHIQGQDIYNTELDKNIPFENLTEKGRAKFLKEINIRILLQSTTLYLLTDWWSSQGANIEKDIAEFMGLEIIYQKG